jgi:hypothetical protein
MKTIVGLILLILASGPAILAQMIFPGDGSTEPGFVPPIVGKPPPPPPAHISSGESYVPYPGPPVTPQARSEKKKPPKPPVLFTKLTSPYGPLDWATRPNDLNNLLKSMKEMINVHFALDVKSVDEVDVDPDRNPILYRSGHFHFSFTPAQRERLRQYLLNGGMLVLNTGMGSKPFYDSAIRELTAMFPEAPVRRLGPDHPIFHAYYDLSRVEYRSGVRKAGYTSDEPWFDGVTIQCRTVAIVSRWGMEIGWDAVDDDSLLGYSIESARQLGVNIMSYAIAQRAWAKNLAQAVRLVDANIPSSQNRMRLAQIEYDGEWKTRHAGLSLLLHQFNLKTEIPVKFERLEMRLTDPRLFDCPVVYMTGHEDFRLTAEEAAALREYLKRGGLLFAEACCGRKSFDAAFQREMRRVLPGIPLLPIPLQHPIFTLPNAIASVGVTPALAAQLETAAIEPRLFAMELDGHFAVIYSPFGLAGGWELSQSPYAFGYDDASAMKIGENILLYAITQ